MLGRQETEGVLGKSRTAGLLPDLGSAPQQRNKVTVPGDGWPFRVSGLRGQFTYLLNAATKIEGSEISKLSP